MSIFDNTNYHWAQKQMLRDVRISRKNKEIKSEMEIYIELYNIEHSAALQSHFIYFLNFIP